MSQKQVAFPFIFRVQYGDQDDMASRKKCAETEIP